MFFALNKMSEFDGYICISDLYDIYDGKKDKFSILIGSTIYCSVDLEETEELLKEFDKDLKGRLGGDRLEVKVRVFPQPHALWEFLLLNYFEVRVFEQSIDPIDLEIKEGLSYGGRLVKTIGIDADFLFEL